MLSLKLQFVTIRLLPVCLHQPMRLTGFVSRYVSRWSAVIGGFRSPLPVEKLFPQMGPLRKQLLIGTMRIETHQSQPTIVILMVTHNQSTPSPHNKKNDNK